MTDNRRESDARKISESSDRTCVVCFRYFEIFSIGECDHPVCFECSTRMRVLCQKHDCPICRQGLSKVIFTNENRSSYRELETKNRSELYNKKYKICFSNIQIQKAFYDLLEHPCPRCEARTFRSFDALKDHVRKEHELFYCDICTDNLKIFSFERRCYNRQELGMHRRKGDPDNTSHKGHPLCQYCDCRYLDRDELFRHLRREHYFCHFCDADGANQFYGNVDTLREHFRAEHYLCEEGDCAREQFTAVFRTDIDLRAHISNIHGKTMGKQQAKQARTLQLEITLGPRGRTNQQDQTSAHLRSRGNNNDYIEMESMHSLPPPVQNTRMIDARNEQDFPSLSGAGTSSAVTVVHPNMSIRAKTFGPAGLARTKENFPALGNGGTLFSDTGLNDPGNSKYNQPASAILKNQKVPQQKPNGGGSMVIHVSNRPNNSIGKKVPNQIDFPALPGSSRSQSNIRKEEYTRSANSNNSLNSTVKNKTLFDDYSSRGQPNTKFMFVQKENTKPSKKQQQQHKEDEDYIPPTTTNMNMNSVSAKHRSLVDDYESKVQLSSKLALIQKDSNVKTSNKSPEFSIAAPNLDTSDFPALSASAPSEPFWIKSQRHQERENRKSKVAPAPLLNGPNNDNSNAKKNNESKRETKKKSPEIENNNNKKTVKANEKKPNQDSKKAAENTVKTNDAKQTLKQTKEKKSPANNNEIKATNKNNSNKPKERDNFMNDMNNKKDFPTLGNSGPKTSSTSSSSSSSSAPPGFDFRMNEMKSPPPGFKSVTLNSVAKPTNNMTFTNSLGENFSILPTHQYLPPPGLTQRNQQLVKHFQNALNSREALAEFRFISQKFREGVYKTHAYFLHCQAALGDQFDDIFPELLVLLPDISKQQELYLVYSQYLNLNSLFATPKQSKVKAMLTVCKNCKQIVSKLDLVAHIQAHTIDSDFPDLKDSNSIMASSFRN